MAKNNTAVTLTFGDQTFDIRATTVTQLEAIENAIRTPGISAVNVAIGVITAGLGRDHSTVKVGDLEATPEEMKTAMGQVLLVAGFTPATAEA